MRIWDLWETCQPCMPRSAINCFFHSSCPLLTIMIHSAPALFDSQLSSASILFTLLVLFMHDEILSCWCSDSTLLCFTAISLQKGPWSTVTTHKKGSRLEEKLLYGNVHLTDIFPSSPRLCCSLTPYLAVGHKLCSPLAASFPHPTFPPCFLSFPHFATFMSSSLPPLVQLLLLILPGWEHWAFIKVLTVSQQPLAHRVVGTV